MGQPPPILNNNSTNPNRNINNINNQAIAGITNMDENVLQTGQFIPQQQYLCKNLIILKIVNLF